MPRPLAMPAAPAVQDSELLSVILSELLSTRRDLRELRADVAALRFPASAPGDAALGALLAAIHAAVGDRVFSAGDLLIHAALPQAKQLHVAIVSALGVANARRLGKCFARIEGRDLGGLSVVRINADQSGILWRVSQTQSSCR